MKNAVKVLVFVLVVAIAGAGAVWFYLSQSTPEFSYEDGAKNDTIELNEYSGDDKNVIIPDKYKGKAVTAVSAEAFLRTDIISVEIPDSVTVIDNKAFYECTELETVKISENLKTIGESAFINCKNLKSIRLPASLETIGPAAFYGCENLTFEIDEGADFIFEDGVLYNKAKTIVYWISDSKDLTKFSFPASVTSFQPYAIAGHSELKSFKIPDGVTDIPDCMFLYCENLETVIVPASVKKIGTSVFLGDTKLKEISLPKSVGVIGENNFPVRSSSSDFVLKVYENSSAYFYAQENDINFELIK